MLTRDNGNFATLILGIVSFERQVIINQHIKNFELVIITGIALQKYLTSMPIKFFIDYRDPEISSHFNEP